MLQSPIPERQRLLFEKFAGGGSTLYAIMNSMFELPRKTTVAILASHKVGHVVPCLGIARALGVEPQIRHVNPRGLYRLMAPYGPPDPRDGRNTPEHPLRRPFPDIVIASGRETVPYLRAMKKRSGGRTFTVFLGDPRTSQQIFDLIAVPEHDSLRGNNVVTYLTAPHPHDQSARAAVRANPHPGIASLPEPRAALLIGGPNKTYWFDHQATRELAIAARTVLNWDASLMVSTSRRTPVEVTDALKAELAKSAPAQAKRTFIWDGKGENPYPTMLALADFFIVTADSTNMIGEAVATGKPVYVLEPTGSSGKFAHLIAELKRRGAIRSWQRRLEACTYAPVDSTPDIAARIAARYSAFIRQP